MAAHIRDYQGGRVAFVGIGGCSMSGLAGLMKELGYQVTGSDRTASHKTEHLEAQGIPVSIGHRPENVRGADLVVYTAAIPSDNPERAEARRLGIPQMERATLLGQLMEGYTQAVGVSGTHGKTTTTAMLSQVFVECGVRPTVHIGGELDAVGGSTPAGGLKFLSPRPASSRAASGSSSHHHHRRDHLDFYKDIDDTKMPFHRCRPHPRGRLGGGLGRRQACTQRDGAVEPPYPRPVPTTSWWAEQLSYDELGWAHFTATLFGHPCARWNWRCPAPGSTPWPPSPSPPSASCPCSRWPPAWPGSPAHHRFESPASPAGWRSGTTATTDYT